MLIYKITMHILSLEVYIGPEKIRYKYLLLNNMAVSSYFYEAISTNENSYIW